jgi:phosphoribosylaminoimidazole-succinocarboxamide synthase
MQVVRETALTEFPLRSRGKVRDIYETGTDTLLIVTTDRMSAFDVVMNEPIPHKGVILNKITLFWMEKFASLVDNHILAADPKDFPKALAPHADLLEGRAVLVRKAKPLPIECIVRGFITGSGWKDYRKTGQVCGHTLPKDLKESEKLAQPLFTPSTKADLGQHDENITLDAAKAMLGPELLAKVEGLALGIYSQGRDYAATRGILIADTKFEFGLVGDKLLLIDEVLTPDSSRFWPAAGFTPGKSQPSFDKQYLRDWLSAQPWGKTPPPPTLPAEVIEQTRNKYMEAYQILTGERLAL